MWGVKICALKALIQWHYSYAVVQVLLGEKSPIPFLLQVSLADKAQTAVADLILCMHS